MPAFKHLLACSQGHERELAARQQEAEAADRERKAAAQRHQRDLAQEAARLQGIADQQQVLPWHQLLVSAISWGMASYCLGCVRMACGAAALFCCQ